MTFLEDFNKIHPNLREILLGILFVSGFWFIDIYLFHKQFFISSPLYLIITFSVCLSLCSLIPNCLTMTFALPDSKNYPDENYPIFFGIIMSIFVMGIFTMFGYWLELKFTSYMKLIFYSETIILLLIGNNWRLQNNRKKNKEKQEAQNS